jgi:hypothetical protein
VRNASGGARVGRASEWREAALPVSGTLETGLVDRDWDDGILEGVLPDEVEAMVGPAVATWSSAGERPGSTKDGPSGVGERVQGAAVTALFPATVEEAMGEGLFEGTCVPGVQVSAGPGKRVGVGGKTREADVAIDAGASADESRVGVLGPGVGERVGTVCRAGF